MVNFLKKHKKQIIKMIIMLGTLVIFSLLSMLILMLFNVIYIDGGIKLNIELFSSFTDKWYGWVIIILLQIGITSLLCFIPGASMAFILLIQMLTAEPWKAFLIAVIGVLLTSFAMYIMGRFGGFKLCKKIIGEEDAEKALKLLNNKGDIYFPLMMMFPIFPDDALVMIAGMMKMPLKWFIPSVVIGRSIGIATIVFGLSIVPFDKFTTIFHWIVFVLVCGIFILGIFFLAYKFNKYLENKKVE